MIRAHFIDGQKLIFPYDFRYLKKALEDISIEYLVDDKIIVCLNNVAYFEKIDESESGVTN